MLWHTIFWLWKRFLKIDNKWFFSGTPGWTKEFLLVFVKGDMLILLPLLGAILLLSIISLKLMLAVLGSYIAVRYFIEAIYWLFQQFGARKYRPGDFGFKDLDNHAIYIIYQTIATAWVVVGLTLTFYSLLYLN